MTMSRSSINFKDVKQIYLSSKLQTLKMLKDVRTSRFLISGIIFASLLIMIWIINDVNSSLDINSPMKDIKGAGVKKKVA